MQRSSGATVVLIDAHQPDADVFRALASEVRLQILGWLAEPHGSFESRREGDLAVDGGVCVSLIAERAGMSQPTVSRHLDVLRRARLVRTRRVANWNFHYRDETGITEARRLLDAL